MKGLFKEFDKSTFTDKFSDEERCLAFLAEEKWKNGFECRKCGHTNYCKGRTPYSRRCTRCKATESATANTAFHKCKIPLTEAFRIAFYVCHDPGISTYKLSNMLDIRQMTCWNFKRKITECLEGRADLTNFQKVEIKRDLSGFNAE